MVTKAKADLEEDPGETESGCREDPNILQTSATAATEPWIAEPREAQQNLLASFALRPYISVPVIRVVLILTRALPIVTRS